VKRQRLVELSDRQIVPKKKIKTKKQRAVVGQLLSYYRQKIKIVTYYYKKTTTKNYYKKIKTKKAKGSSRTTIQ
jgi:hypothetical protein